MKRLLLTLPLLLSACATIPGTNRQALILVSRQQELAMGQQAYREMLAKEKLSTNARWNEILQRVGKRIAATTPVTDFQWEFKLIESPQMNAFCLPGGKVAVYTGILPIMQNEAGMAIVIGHEVAHAVARHGAQRVSQGMLAELGGVALNVAFKDSAHRNTILGLYGVGATVGVLLPYSRGNETEADTLGLRYAAVAGYDPAEGPRFWERFAKATGGGKPPEFLSTHPSDSSRIQNMRALSAEAAAAYATSPRYGLGEHL